MAGEGDGRGRNRWASLEVRVGGTPGGVGAASLPGTAPRTGRSFAGAHPAAQHTVRIATKAVLSIEY
jgi:hypothetical protein